MNPNTFLLLGALVLVTGCASTAQIEQKQLAYRGGGGLSNPCLFGGVTAQSQAHCMAVEFGTEGMLISANTTVVASLSRGADCKDHVASLSRKLAADPTLKVEPVYSCPDNGGAKGICHVSALVTDALGARYVVDNGAVLGVGYAGVAPLDRFVAELGGEYWVGQPPSHAQAIGLETFMRDSFAFDAWGGVPAL